jgi:hypothetical protein
MAFYTDYEETVLYSVSVLKTKSKVANVLANMLADHGGFTLIGLADESASSSATNYAELTRNGLTFKIYNTSSTSSTLGQMTTYISNSSGATDNYGSVFDYEASAHVRVRLRFYNVKDGVLAGPAAIISAQDFADNLNTKYLWIRQTGSIGSSTFSAIAEDGSAATLGWAPIPELSTSSGYQTMSQIVIEERYLANYVFASKGYLSSGIIKINNRYFYTGSADAGRLTFELNP